MKRSTSVHTRRMISWPLEMLLRLFGIWPGVSYGPLCKVFWLIVMITNTSFQYLFLILDARSTKFIYAFPGTLSMSMKLVKLIIFWSNQRRFDEMWATVSMNWQRGNGYTDAAGTTGKKQAVHYLANFVVAFSSASVVLNSFENLSAGIHYDEASNGTRPYVMSMHLPFDVNRQSVYLSVIFLQFFYLLVTTAVGATTNSVLIILMLYLGDQIDNVCTCLTKMPQGENNCRTNVIIRKEIIQKHQSVITFSESVESMYTYIALMLIILNTLITCTLGFILVTSVGSPHFTKMLTKNLLFYCVINTETFVFCFAGEYISAKSRQIGEAAYSSPWYQSKFHGHAALFMIIRSQNQLTFTMGKFANLSLELFSTIIKTSASYVSVLLAIY
ncbi:odorant receptor 4-like [Odontomachus brunneus]|uniref:odorant receptor 4-like n=1 Tax=Odontomachus brunneus TaxID=486640 RepID=UPI0013F2AA74|nr:odorant receptor 4-like [Odontomachus brunneus]